MKKLQMQTLDLIDENIEKLLEIFPHCVTEKENDKGKLKKTIDFNLLEQELSKYMVDGPKERYRLDWPGKRESLLSANTPITKTLRPAIERSVDFDTTQNLYIEGDNLEALKLLQESYLGEIKMIYIDPPYNTGKDFVYKDNFKRTIEEELQESGQIDEEGGRLVANLESNGRFHSNWLSMMYPRLRLSRNLLKDDGVIVIHIDEAEYDNLYKICQEIFGESNNLGTMIWDKGNPKGDSKTIAVQNEFIIAFAKDINAFMAKNNLKRAKKNAQKMLNKAKQLYKKLGKKVLPDDIKECIKNYSLDLNEEDFRLVYKINDVNAEYQKWLGKQDFSNGEKAYKYIDENGKVYRGVSMAWPNKKKAPDEYMIPLIHPITKKECPLPSKGWRNPPKTMKELLDSNMIIFGEDETKQPERKYLLEENMYENIPSVLFFGGSDDSFFKTIDLTFDNPKPYRFSQELISYFTKDNEIILDFFSGSATTAHAVMQQNLDDKSNRKYILVQLPETIDEKSDASKDGKYKTITDLGIKRIMETGKLIRANNLDLEDISDFDMGVRVLKIDESNMKDIYFSPDEVDKSNLFDTVDHIKEDRTTEDLLFGVLVDWGVDLTLPIRREEILGKTVFFVSHDDLTACFDEELDEAFIKELAGRDAMRVVFKENGFKDDETKINAEQIFTQLSPGTDLRVI